jgi:predicted transcriptional regulator
MTDTLRFTSKQIDVLEKILKGADNGDFLDTNQLMEKISYTPTKRAFQFTLRYLIQRGLIEKAGLRERDGRKRMTYTLTPQALRSFDINTGSFDVVMEGFDEDDEEKPSEE